MRLGRIEASGEVGLRAGRLAIGVAVAGLAAHAFALGLGEPNVASVLGQPLQMTVPLMMDAGTQLTQECVRIIPGNQSGDPTPSLNAGRITIDSTGRQLRIESLRPIGEPTLRVAVEVGCNEHIRREFALLLDPPSMGAPASSSGLAASGQSVSSLGLGMAQMSAVIGQRLTMKVPVVGPDAGSLTAACVHLADPVSSEGAPVLRQADIRVLPYEGGSLIEVATPVPVTQPAVRLALDVGCRDPVRREYAVLLGLPPLAASNAGTTVAAAEPAPETEPKPSLAQATKAHKSAPAVPVAPESDQTRVAAQPHETSARAPQAAVPGPDRLVLGSPQEIVSLSALGSDASGALDPSAELAKRMDAMSRQIEALQAQLLASRQHEQELQRRALETREQWTWSMIALAVLLLLGSLAMAWRQRRPVAQVPWEPVVTRPPQVTVPRPVMPRVTADIVARESSAIAGRATMPGRATNPSVPITGITEPSLADERNSQITVTELHDTVQVIKELYATVLERNTSSTSGGSGGKKPSRPLELDLRTPAHAAPTASPPPLAEPARSESSDKRATEERFTQLPTEVGLDLDLASVVGSAPEVVLTDLLAPGITERALPVEESSAASAKAPVQAANPGGPSDDNLTQAPTEVLIDIDVGTTTGFSPATVAGAPRLSPQRPEAERGTRNAASKLEPIDLQLDLSQSQARPKQRAERGA